MFQTFSTAHVAKVALLQFRNSGTFLTSNSGLRGGRLRQEAGPALRGAYSAAQDDDRAVAARQRQGATNLRGSA